MNGNYSHLTFSFVYKAKMRSLVLNVRNINDFVYTDIYMGIYLFLLKIRLIILNFVVFCLYQIEMQQSDNNMNYLLVLYDIKNDYLFICWTVTLFIYNCNTLLQVCQWLIAAKIYVGLLYMSSYSFKLYVQLQL